MIRQRTKVTDFTEHDTKTKWKWPGHVTRVKDDRWVIGFTEWKVMQSAISFGRSKRRWIDDTGQEGARWSGTAENRQGWRSVAQGYFPQ